LPTLSEDVSPEITPELLPLVTRPMFIKGASSYYVDWLLIDSWPSSFLMLDFFMIVAFWSGNPF
jgi:hypothetical protein